MPAQSSRSVLIIEEELATYNGHWFQYIQDMAQGFRELGDDVAILGPITASEAVIRGTGCLPLLPPSARYRHQVQSNSLSTLGRIFGHNLKISQTVRRFVHQSGKDWDLVIAPTNLVDHVLGHLATLQIAKKRLKRFLCIFPDLPGGMNDEYTDFVFPRSAKLFRKFLRGWTGAIRRDRGRLAVESYKMKLQYEALAGVPFNLVPHVVHLPPVVKKNEEAEEYTIGCFGAARYDKGLDILDRAIEIFLNEMPSSNVKFIVQWSRPYHLPGGSEVSPSEFLRNSPHVELIETDFDSSAYFQHLCQVDAMVLPYRKFFYFTKLSRVAIDSAIAGRPFVFPTGTWMEDFAGSFGAGVSFEPENAASLAAALKSLVTQRSELRETAESRMADARSEHAPSAFAKVAWQLFDSASPTVR